ncbi:uncharacterized protein K441DRAFT_668038 [Cenococcum geophilum 1.58]|uniref:uncharacterized protein n=1 Tax=Cenococcum geophilum 1.58 TaxID=794803 RepID=UPI00358EAFB0|nr:hypothetical protein K441DRAFT_668038 [Cenococcum geophilum 1.58]
MNQDDHPTIASLHKATYGILFFATPHKDMIVEDIRMMLACQDNHPRHVLLQRINRESDLTSQLVDFKNLIRDRRIVGFYETEQTRRLEFSAESQSWRRTGHFITAVDTNAALLHLPDHIEDKIPPPHRPLPNRQVW